MHLRLILLCIQLCWIIIIIIIIIIINSKIIIVIIIIIIIIATLIIVKYFFLTRRRRYRCWNGCRHWKQWKRMNPKVCAAHIWFKVKKYNEKTYVSPTHPVVPQVSISKFSPLQKLSGVVGGGLEQSRVRIRKPTPQLWLQELQLLQSDHALTPNKDCGINPCKLIYLVHDSSHARKSKTVLDSGLHAVRSGFQVLDSSLCQWNLDSGFQSLVGFQIPNSRISDSTSKIFPNAGLHEQKCPGFRNPHSLTWGDKIQNSTAVFNIWYIFIVWYLRKYL